MISHNCSGDGAPDCNAPECAEATTLYIFWTHLLVEQAYIAIPPTAVDDAISGALEAVAAGGTGQSLMDMSMTCDASDFFAGQNEASEPPTAAICLDLPGGTVAEDASSAVTSVISEVVQAAAPGTTSVTRTGTTGWSASATFTGSGLCLGITAPS
jgi:hypothetical protein